MDDILGTAKEDLPPKFVVQMPFEPDVPFPLRPFPSLLFSKLSSDKRHFADTSSSYSPRPEKKEHLVGIRIISKSSLAYGSKTLIRTTILADSRVHPQFRQKSSTVAASLTQLSSTLSDIFDRLSSRAVDVDNQQILQTLQHIFGDYSAATFTTAAATLLALLFLLARHLMSYRNSFSSLYASGRASPYASTIGQDGRTFSDLYEYVDANNVDPGAGHARSSHNSISYASNAVEDEAPDVIHVRFGESTFPIHFPAYGISEATVITGDLRRKVAERLSQDYRRVRLVYKDRDLRTDRRSLKHYGCKQNSEVLVIITEHLSEYDEHHSSEGEVGVGGAPLQPTQTNDRRRPRGLSEARYRSDRSDDYRHTTDSSGFLQPTITVAGGHRRSPSRDGDRRQSTNYDHARTRSRSPAPHATSRPGPSPIPTPARSPPRARADPNSPMGKVQKLEDEYYDNWLPKSQSYLESPPNDQQTREKDWRTLSESIMSHIIEAADAIELQGDQKARAERKSLLNTAQELIKRLDAVGKPR